METFLNTIDKCTKALAKIAGWCVILMMLFQAISVIARYVFNYSILVAQEAVVYGHAMLFLLGAAFILQLNQHVRVDVFYANMSVKLRRKIDLIALLVFVIPFAITLIYVGAPYILNAWRTLEGSRQSGGLPAIYLLKSCIGVFALSVGLQAVALILRLLQGSGFIWGDDRVENSPNGEGEM